MLALRKFPQIRPKLTLVSAQTEAQKEISARLLEKNKADAKEMLLAIRILLAQTPR
jgi:hypothetical protein